MARWSKAPAYKSEGKSTHTVWTACLHYVQDNGATWYNKVEVYAHSELKVLVLQEDLISFLNAQETLGVSHG